MESPEGRLDVHFGAGGAGAAALADERIGLHLRNVRRAKGLTLNDISQSLKIRKVYLEAIEKSRFADLPGCTYALGFVRSYAQHLELDPEMVVERFRDEIAGIETETDLSFPAPIKEGKFPGGAVVAASVVLAVAIYGGWYWGSQGGGATQFASDRAPVKAAKVETVKSAPAKSAPAKLVKTASARIAARPAPAAKVRTVKAPPAAKPVVAAAAKPVVKLAVEKKADEKKAETPKLVVASSFVSEAAMRAKSDREAADRARIEQAKAAKSKLAGMQQPVSGKARIILSAVQDTWVEIRLSDGTMVLSKILKAGQIYPVLQNRGLILTAGNAGGLRIIVDGQVMPALGPNGMVRKGIRLDADKLLASR